MRFQNRVNNVKKRKRLYFVSKYLGIVFNIIYLMHDVSLTTDLDFFHILFIFYINSMFLKFQFEIHKYYFVWGSHFLFVKGFENSSSFLLFLIVFSVRK